MHTGHAANIFSVKFLPHSGDRILVTGAADTKVHVHDLTAKETIHMFSEHTNRLVEAKCLAVNPRDNNYLAVGANGPFVRLYDIRMIHNHRKSMSQSTAAGVHTFCDRQNPIPDGAGQYYVAGHLPVKLPDYNSRLRVLVTTYVTFSPDGTELLVNMGGEQVYLFDLTFKQRPYTFLLPKKCHPNGGTPRCSPVQLCTCACTHHGNTITCVSVSEVQNGKTSTNGIHLPASHLRLAESKICSGSGDLPPHLERVKQQANDAFARQQWTQAIQLYSLGIHQARHNAMLAISLNPGHLKAHFRLARCLFELKYVAEALECLDDFKGNKGQYIVSGSDDGSFFIWEKETTNLVRILQGDESIVNCLQPHPSYCFLATSGIDPVVRLWNPRPETERENGRVVEDMEGAAQANQRRMNADPLEVMLLNMGYRITGLSSGPPEGSDEDDSSEGQREPRSTALLLNFLPPSPRQRNLRSHFLRKRKGCGAAVTVLHYAHQGADWSQAHCGGRAGWCNGSVTPPPTSPTHFSPTQRRPEFIRSIEHHTAEDREQHKTNPTMSMEAEPPSVSLEAESGWRQSLFSSQSHSFLPAFFVSVFGFLPELWGSGR
ncbi:hypothetical protein JZ751_014961 [Albula glossodonta]|uniref:WD and tetratricopeptide repeats protein 1 n=1 Tax=Albula glossodonta TaxID=121402 RepID=A0A8T2MV39_9TELE|nr:hypothetical protein JZ751_014961 [Albula glossodonta]